VLTGIGEALQAALRPGPDDGQVEAPAELQSWPGIVHGGALVALLDAAAARLGVGPGPRVVEVRLTAPVPHSRRLSLRARAGGEGTEVTLADDGHTLTSGTVRPAGVDAGAGPGAGERLEVAAEPGWTLPMSESCLACGAENPLGLQAALTFDGAGVWARLGPREPWRLPGGRTHPALAPVVLDEVAWWLGALTMQEGGLTNRIHLELLDGDPLPPGPLLAGGRFADLQPVDRKRTFWRASVALADAGGRLLARAGIVFRGGPEYSARQVPYFRARTSPATFRRMFPRYA
jgi:hypothetical protein